MDTVTKATQAARSTDRLLEALSTLAALLDRTINEVKSLDNSFQERLLHAVHVAEVSLQSQAAAHLEKALTDTELKVRKELTTELQTQFDVDMNEALASNESRMAEEFSQKAALLESEAAARLEKALTDSEAKVRRELTSELQTQFDVDMKEALASDQSRMAEEFSQKTALLESEAAANLEKVLTDTEAKVRKELTSELQTQFDVDIKDALASSRSRMADEFRQKAADMEARWEEERQTLMMEIEATTEKAKTMVPPEPAGASAVLLSEMERIRGLVASISAVIEDPSTELSLGIRKNAERAELESYLKGIRFAVGK